MPNPENLQKLDSKKAAEIGRKGGLAKKGSKHLATHIQDALNDPDFEIKLKDGSILREMPIKAIIKTAVAKSISGDTRAMEWLAKHGYGEKIKIDIENPIKQILEQYGGGKGEDIDELPTVEKRSSEDNT